MKLPAPIYRLKSEAKARASAQSIPLYAALDIVASEQGYDRWSLLTSRYNQASTAAKLYAQLMPGELVLVAARPGLGKSMIALECVIEAARSGERSMIFSLEYTPQQLEERLKLLGATPETISRIAIDCSEAICAQTIVEQLAQIDGSTLVVIDYLQLLDQRRSNPPLTDQIAVLRDATRHKARMLLISQVDRRFEASGRTVPTLDDIRLPNPLNLTLFDTAWLIGGDKVTVTSIRKN